MSIMYCDKHDSFCDSDFVEECASYEEEQSELDQKETEAYAELQRQEDIENGVMHDIHEPTTYELAEQERNHKYLWDAKYFICT